MSLPRFRASSADRVLTCHGSIGLVSKVEGSTIDLGENDGHEITWAGSWCHYQAALRLIQEYGAVGVLDPLRIPSHWAPSGYDEWVVDFYVKGVLAVTPPTWALVVEEEFEAEFSRFILTGHIDCFTISPDFTIACINDLKRGFGTVDKADVNWQLACYAVLLKLKFPALQKILLRIHQPSEPDRVSEFVADNLDQVVAFIEQCFNAALDDPYTLETSKACLYCAALLVCPAFRKELEEMKITLAKEEFEKISPVIDIKSLAQTVAIGRKIKSPLEKLETALLARLEQQKGIPVEFEGGSVVANDGVGNREITDREFAFTTLAGTVGQTHAIQAFKPSFEAITEVLHKQANLPKSSKDKEKLTCASWIDRNLGGVIKREKKVSLTWTSN